MLYGIAVFGAGRGTAYTGMSGLIHVPSADMGEEGEARAGVHFLNREFTPNVLTYKGDKYHTMGYYLMYHARSAGWRLRILVRF